MPLGVRLYFCFFNTLCLTKAQVNKHLTVVWLPKASSSLFLPKFTPGNKPVEKFRPRDIPIKNKITYLPRVRIADRTANKLQERYAVGLSQVASELQRSSGEAKYRSITDS